MKHPYEPSDQAALILQAALADSDRAAAAWHAWRRGGGSLDDAPDEFVRLFPLVQLNLPPDVAGAADSGRLAGLRRRTWYLNQLRTQLAAVAFGALARETGPPMLLKGLAIATAVPHGMSVRTMRDVDLLVRPAELARTLVGLKAQGLTGDLPEGGLRRILHAVPLTFPNGSSVDLHWRPLHRAADDGPLWAGATRGMLHDLPVLQPCLEDLVLHACVHAMSMDATPLQWIADVTLAVRAGGPAFSWERVVEGAQRQDAEVPVRAALSLLARRFELAVPASALRELRSGRPQVHSRVLHLAATNGSRGRASHYLWQWELYRRDARVRGERPSPRGFLSVLADVAGLDRARRLPAHWLRRAAELARGGAFS